MEILKRNSRVYLLTQLFHSLVFTIPIWIAYYQGFLNPIQISTLVAFQYVLQILMELPSGALADLLGRRSSLNLSFLLGSFSFLLFPFAREFWHFMSLAALIGVSDSFRSGSEEALVYDSFKKSDTEGFDKLYSRGNLIYQFGLICGTLTGGVLYEINKFIPFFLYGISLLFGFVTSFFYYEPKIDSEKFSLKNYIKQIKDGIKESFKDEKTTYTSLYYVAVGSITWTNALYFASFFVIGLGFGDAQRGFIQGGVRILNALAITYVLSRVKLSDKARVIFFPIVMLLGFLPGTFVDGWAGIPFLELAMLSGTARWIFLTPLTNRAFNSKVRATAISVLSLLIGVVYIVIVGISGPIIQKYDIGTMYTLLGIITIFTVVPLSIKLLRVSKSVKVVDSPLGSDAKFGLLPEGEIG